MLWLLSMSEDGDGNRASDYRMVSACADGIKAWLFTSTEDQNKEIVKNWASSRGSPLARYSLFKYSCGLMSKPADIYSKLQMSTS